MSAEVASAGEFFTFDLDGDSIIVVRDENRALHALHNTCRHRGMPVCEHAAGTTTRWVCPYHQWSYALDGSLLGAGGMERELDLAGIALGRAEVHEIGGLVFVRADCAVDCGSGEAQPWAVLDQAREELARALVPQGLEHARVAHRIDYRVEANWKLVWENNRECWHCHLGHPEYSRANFDAAPDNQRTRELARSRQDDHARALADVTSRAAANCLAGADLHSGPGLYSFPTPGRWWSANRTPLAPGYVTESLDGKPVAPLMGAYSDHDVGTLRLRSVPNFWCHASADHAVLTRLLPRGPRRTEITVTWLVDQDAVEGRDYTLERLLPFWQLTSEQDWSLCERNQAGVASPAHLPGPYSPTREHNVIAFVDWYLERLRAP